MTAPPSPDGYVKKETLILVAMVAVAAGFLMGVLFAAYKGGRAPIAPAARPVQSTAPAPEMNDQQANRMFALEKKAAEHPEDAGAWIELGNLYFDTGNIKKAITAYNKSLELAPDNPDVWTDLGVMYRRNGEPEKAIAAFDKAIAADPTHEVSRFNKGIVLLHDLKDTQGAIRVWESLLKVNPMAMAPNGQSVDELVRRFKSSQSGS